MTNETDTTAAGMTDAERYAARRAAELLAEREASDAFHATMAAVCAILGSDWTTDARHGNPAFHGPNVRIYARVGTYGAERDRILLTGSAPDGVSHSDGDYHRLTAPSITVAGSKSPEAIARDMTRRLIPAATEYWTAISERIAARLTAADMRETFARELAGIMGTRARQTRDSWMAELPENVIGTFTVNYDGTEATAEIRGMSTEAARLLAAFLATWNVR